VVSRIFFVVGLVLERIGSMQYVLWRGDWRLELYPCQRFRYLVHSQSSGKTSGSVRVFIGRQERLLISHWRKWKCWDKSTCWGSPSE
jgi:hypothetical protein